MTVLVTGASGFIGTAVVRELRERQHSVRVLVRRSTGQAWDSSVEQVRGDVRGSPLSDAVSGASAVIHLAASVLGDDNEKFSSIAVGTERLIAALEGSSVRRLVLVSTRAVYDWRDAHGRVTEESPLADPNTTADGYAAAKVWSERIARRAAVDAPWELTVVRPGIVWAHGREEVGSVGLTAGPVTVVLGPRRTLDLVHRDDCAALIVRAMEDPRAAGRTYNAVDPESPSAWRYARLCTRAQRSRRLLVPLPYAPTVWAAKSAKALADRAVGLTTKLPAAIAPDRLEAKMNPAVLSGDRARAELGWRPTVSLDGLSGDYRETRTSIDRRRP